MLLNCHTAFSFKYGTLPPKMLFEEAKRCNVKKLVVTDINNTASYMELLRICQLEASKGSYNLEIAVGVEFRQGSDLHFIAIAKNNAGFESLNRFLSHLNRDNISVPKRAPAFDDVFIIYPFGICEPFGLRENEFIGVKRHHVTQYAMYEHREPHKDKFIAWHPVTFLPHTSADGKASKRDFNIHRLLRAIANNTVLSKLPKEQEAREDEFMISEDELTRQFANFPELIANAKHVVERSQILLNPREDKNKKSIRGSKDLDISFLRSETWKGFARVYPMANETFVNRIEKELAIIAAKEFTAYYLIAYDLINFAKSKNFDYVGRGSGANSCVAYCLGITNVDPIELNLYFERFLNEERTTPPDFDLDFSWDNRDEIYEYLFSKYGNDHVCLLGTHVTYQWRSIVRELAKVFGLPKDEIDAIVENPAEGRNRDHIANLVCTYASYIIAKELPSNFSIHAGGVLITEKRIYAYTATEMPNKGLPVSHFEMHNAEDFGIYKLDVLSQRGLGHIKESVKQIGKNQGVQVNAYDFARFKDDEKVKALLRNGRTMGCFYVESPAMRMLLAKLQCDDYLTLVAASSIIRPGVASSGMMRQYIERFHKVKNGMSYESVHPKMQELMAETFGVMVYQEDVIKVAHEFAGLSLTEADVLRRGMSGKYRSREEFEKVKQRFFESCVERGYDKEIINRVWFEIESFSGYSFAKGHSASYAVESYQSLFLKAHFPLEFMVSVINNFGGFYKTEFYFHEARMNGAIIEAPCVNNSDQLTSIHGNVIYVGFVHLKSLESAVAERICNARQQYGQYKSLSDFLDRVEAGLEQIRILIRIGAFRFTGKSKQALLWEAMLFFSESRNKAKASHLFETKPKEYPLPALSRNWMEDAYDELELLGFPICDPFILLPATDFGDSSATELFNKLQKPIHIVGYVVTTKETRTKNKETMNFGTFLDRNGDVFDTVHFPDIARRFPFRGRGFYSIKGRVVAEFGVAMIEVSQMEKLSMVHKRADEFMREPVESRERSKVANSVF